MSFVYPHILFFLLVLPVVYWLSAILKKRLVVTAGSITLWQRVLESSEKQRSSRVNWFDGDALLLGLAAGAAILAAAGPHLPEKEDGGDPVLIVVDRSASTRAQVVGGKTVFDEIRERVKRGLKNLLEEDELLLIAAPDGEVFFRGRASEGILGAVGEIVPQDLPDDWRGLGSLLSSWEERPTRTLVFSDVRASSFVDSSEWTCVRELDGALPNVGLVEFGIREVEPDVLGIFLTVAATDRGVPAAPTVGIRVVAETPEGERVLLDRGLEFESGVSRVLCEFPDLSGNPAIRAQLVFPRDGMDSLSSDNEVVGLAGEGRPFRIALSSRYAHLKRAFEVVPGVRVEQPGGEVFPPPLRILRPEAEQVVNGEFPVIILPGSSRSFFLTKGGEQIRVQVGAGYRPVKTRIGPDAGALTFGSNRVEVEIPLAVELTFSSVDDVSVLMVAETAEQTQPLIVRWGACLVLAFDPEKGSWPTLPSYPIFWSQMLGSFGAGSGFGAPRIHRTGDTISIPAVYETAMLRTPDGETEIREIRGIYPMTGHRVGGFDVVDLNGSRTFRFDLLNRGETVQAGGDTTSRESVRDEEEKKTGSAEKGGAPDRETTSGSRKSDTDLMPFLGFVAVLLLLILLHRTRKKSS